MLRPVRATDVYRLQLVTRTERAPCWVAEVETWVARDAWYWVRDPANQPARLWLAEADGDVAVVAVAQQLAGGLWYVPAVLVDAGARGRGFGAWALAAVIAAVRAEEPEAELRWLVHVDNRAMQAISSAAGACDTGSERLTCGGEEAQYGRWVLPTPE